MMDRIKLTLKLGLIITLLMLSGAPLVFGAGSGDQQELDRRADIERRIGRLEKQRMVLRGASEFIEEVGLFDNHFYGRLTGEREQQRMGEIRNDIRSATGEMKLVENKLSGYGDISEGTPGRNGDYETYSQRMDFLESKLSALNTELAALEARSTLGAPTELLDVSVILEKDRRLDEELFPACLEDQRLLELDRLRMELDRLDSGSRKPESPGGSPANSPTNDN